MVEDAQKLAVALETLKIGSYEKRILYFRSTADNRDKRDQP